MLHHAELRLKDFAEHLPVKHDSDLIENLNNENYCGAAEQLLDITDGGDTGLIKRRNAEYNIFKEASYNAEH